MVDPDDRITDERLTHGRILTVHGVEKVKDRINSTISSLSSFLSEYTVRINCLGGQHECHQLTILVSNEEKLVMHTSPSDYLYDTVRDRDQHRKVQDVCEKRQHDESTLRIGRREVAGPRSGPPVRPRRSSSRTPFDGTQPTRIDATRLLKLSKEISVGR